MINHKVYYVKTGGLTHTTLRPPVPHYDISQVVGVQLQGYIPYLSHHLLNQHVTLISRSPMATDPHCE